MNAFSHTISPYLVAQLDRQHREPGTVPHISSAEDPADVERLTAALQSTDQAIERCSAAIRQSEKDSREQGLNTRETRRRVVTMWRLTMPRMNSHQDVLDYIACATTGMSLGLIDGNEVSKMLYAAQLALAAIRSGGER